MIYNQFSERQLNVRRILFLAYRQLRFHASKTVILIASISVTLGLPLTTRLVVERHVADWTNRAQSTPLVVGSKGSRFDLALNSLYFRGVLPDMLSMRDLDTVGDNDGIEPVPLHVRFTAQGEPVVGTRALYFSKRQIGIATGESWQRVGDCLLGAGVASRLQLGPGDRILSDAQNVFDISGPSTLRMRVTGVLEQTATADDDAVFVSLETAWILEGIGHGHDADKSVGGIDQTHRHSASRANLGAYAEVTDENEHSFHFHGSPDEFPISSIVVFPSDERAATIFMGTFLDPTVAMQVLKPTDVVNDLLGIVFRVKQLLDLLAVILAVVTMLLVGLITALSLRLRQRERQTLFKIGCSRATIFTLLAAELFIVAAAAACIAAVLALTIGRIV